MFKKILLTSLILLITFQSNLIFAETKSFTLSVTIPATLNINSEQQQFAKQHNQSSNVLMQEVKTTRKQTPVIMRSIVSL